MIEFNGSISEKCQKYFSKKLTLRYLLFFGIVFLSIFAIVFPLCFTKSKWEYSIMITAGLCATLMSIAGFNLNKKKFSGSMRVNMQLTINAEQMSCALHSLKSNQCINKTINDVKKVIDFGDGYLICFSCFEITNAWLCQKDLLVQGSIDDFERLFEGKIVRKPIKEKIKRVDA